MLITVTFPINEFTGSHYEPINVILSQLPCRSEFSGHPTTRHSPSIGSLSKPGLHSHSKDPWLSRHVECCFDKHGFWCNGTAHSLIFSHLFPIRWKPSLQLHSKLPMVLRHVESCSGQSEKSSHSSFNAYWNVTFQMSDVTFQMSDVFMKIPR